jgi:4'-phosphopantetheinyl transferase
VAAGREVGVDIEHVNYDRELVELAEQALTHRERALLDNLHSETERRMGFFRAWTRKEAFLKARGDGLATPPADVDTEDELGKIHVRGRWQPGWRVDDLAVGHGYSGAVAAMGEDWCVISREIGNLDQATANS